MQQPIAVEGASPASSRTRRILQRLLLLCVTCCIGLFLLEFGVRLALPAYNPHNHMRFHPYPGGVVLGPANRTVRHATPKGDFDLLVRFNEDGLRDSKRLKDATENDWIAVGDSFTMGYGVAEEDRFSNVLESKFKAHGITARVFNVAAPENIIGYQRFLKYAQAHGASARHLVIGICMENDLEDYTSRESDWDSAVRKGAPLKARIRDWLLDHSALYLVSSFGLQKITFLRPVLEKVGIARTFEQLMGHNVWNEKALNTSRDELVRLAAGWDAVVLIIPARPLWHGPDQDIGVKTHEAFVKMLRVAGLEVVDMRPVLEAGGDPLSYYFKTDPHWIARGHALAAEELFKAIQARTPGAQPGSGNNAIHKL